MEAIILHPQNVEQLSVFKQLFKTMDVPFETTNDESLIVGYSPAGEPFTVVEYKNEIQNRIDAVKSGTVQMLSSEEVLNNILTK